MPEAARSLTLALMRKVSDALMPEMHLEIVGFIETNYCQQEVGGNGNHSVMN